MDKVTVTVSGIKREEYFEAVRLNSRRLYVILFVSMVVICAVIIMATGNLSLKAVVGPLVVFALCVAAWEVITHVSYKGQLETVDPPVVYEFDKLRWKVIGNGQETEVDWRGTTKLKKTKRCLFVYNNDASGNLLPRRLLTPEEEAQLTEWFESSRVLAKAYQKKEERKQREAFRDANPGLKLGRTGPAWGPFRRK